MMAPLMDSALVAASSSHLGFAAPTPVRWVPRACPSQAHARHCQKPSSTSPSFAAAATGVVVTVSSARRSRQRHAHARTIALFRSAEGSIANAVNEGRMISLEEAGIRKLAGGFFAVLFLWQAFLVYTTGSTTFGPSYAILAVLASNACGFGLSAQLSI